MLKWEAAPLIGVNGISFGMNKADVRKRLEIPFTEFKKSSYSDNTVDDFGVAHAFYDPDERLIAIEVFPEVQICLGGVPVFPGPISKALKLIPGLREDMGDYISPRLSIGITVMGDKMETFLLGAEGYYD